MKKLDSSIQEQRRVAILFAVLCVLFAFAAFLQWAELNY